MTMKTQNNTSPASVRRDFAEIRNAIQGDTSYELRGRILNDIKALAAASEGRVLDTKTSRARTQWYALAAYLGDTGILTMLNAAVDDITEDRHPPVDQVEGAISRGEAMHLFLGGASNSEFTRKNKLVEAIIGATEDLDERFWGRQWAMAVADLTRIAYLAEATEDEA